MHNYTGLHVFSSLQIMMSVTMEHTIVFNYVLTLKEVSIVDAISIEQ